MKGPLAQAIWAVVQEVRPDWLLDLHVGTGAAAGQKRSVANSIIHSGTEKAGTMAERMRLAVNETISETDKKFILRKPPVEGSLARAVAARQGTPAMILETSIASQPLALRARQHRIMVHRLLAELGMAASGVDDLPREGDSRLRVGIYADTGARPRSGLDVKLCADGDMAAVWLGLPEIQAGALGQCDVLVMPGGGGSTEAKGLGDKGCEAIRDFVGRGGGYVGICAGAYLASNGYSWSLGIINARAADGMRGKETVKVELLPEGAEILGTKAGPVNVNYQNGPILVSAGASDLPPIIVLAVFRTELVSPAREPRVRMDGAPAMIAAPYRKGRVVCISPHPEATPGLEGLVRAAIRWAAGKSEKDRPLPGSGSVSAPSRSTTAPGVPDAFR
jgi:putative intracellular protease/amidase